MNRTFLPTRNSKILGIFLSFFVVLNTHAKNETNPIVEEILEKAETAFDEAETKDDKFNVVSKKFTFDYLQHKMGGKPTTLQPKKFEDFKIEKDRDNNIRW